MPAFEDMLYDAYGHAAPFHDDTLRYARCRCRHYFSLITPRCYCATLRRRFTRCCHYVTLLFTLIILLIVAAAAVAITLTLPRFTLLTFTPLRAPLLLRYATYGISAAASAVIIARRVFTPAADAAALPYAPTFDGLYFAAIAMAITIRCH